MTPRVWLTSLGCAENQADSDKLTAVLDEASYSSEEATPAAALVVLQRA